MLSARGSVEERLLPFLAFGVQFLIRNVSVLLCFFVSLMIEPSHINWAAPYRRPSVSTTIRVRLRVLSFTYIYLRHILTSPVDNYLTLHSLQFLVQNNFNMHHPMLFTPASAAKSALNFKLSGFSKKFTINLHRTLLGRVSRWLCWPQEPVLRELWPDGYAWSDGFLLGALVQAPGHLG
jgi:hypothetical protein